MGCTLPNNHDDHREGRRRDKLRDRAPSHLEKVSFAGGAPVNGRPVRRRRVQSKTNVITDGPFAESKEMLGGSAWLRCGEVLTVTRRTAP